MTTTPPIPPLSSDQLEKYSSAITLSDMEIFIFPELLYSLVLANMMSPRIWQWREDPWFEGIERLKPYRRILRLKQFIMDRYEFNLDLDTWGLTTKEQELRRFRGRVDEETLSRSNALFGYEGDKYYFDIDIRRHFGLDKYTSEIIPYWKTETVEAMDAFQFRDGYHRGAGECVSLSTLYAAALFIICDIPLEDIFLIATPLHSQNFVTVREGILTNNRRIVTKNMWFNGTEITYKAQRALRNEQITIVANNSGYVHTMYPEATMNPDAYHRFQQELSGFLITDINAEMIANFLRQESQLQTCFQVMGEWHGKTHYIEAERLYAYEHNSSYRVSDHAREKLMQEIDDDEYYPDPVPGRISLNLFEEFFKSHKIDLSKPEDLDRLRSQFNCNNARGDEILEDLIAFCRITPRFPDQDQTKQFTETPPIQLDPAWDRDRIQAELERLRATHPIADLAFYAYRDLTRCDWQPFLKAALERNPVCIEASRDLSDEAILDRLRSFADASIYDGPRLAQPDEVWNYERGDGTEKALCLATIWLGRDPETPVEWRCEPDQVTLSRGSETVTFPTAKGLQHSATLRRTDR
jgi:hypothetical protein